MAQVLTAPRFDETQDDWVEFTERLGYYFVANAIDDGDKQRAILLTSAGASTYRLVKSLVLPQKVTEFTFQELVEKVKTHFNPKPSPIMKRFQFNTRCQQEGESVGVFVAALRSIAEHCDYGDSLKDMLRDRIVCGIRDKSVQCSLLKESKLTYDTALDTALAAESAKKDAQKLQDSTKVEGHSLGDVCRVEDKPSSQGNKSLQDGGKESKTVCYRCGGKHDPSHCRFREAECHYCKKRGHIATVCRKKKSRQKQGDKTKAQANHVDGGEDSDNYSMFQVSTSSTRPLMVTVQVNGVDLEMELDTGASVSLVGEETFRRIQGNASILQPSKAGLYTYTGESIAVLGSADVQVEHHGQSLKLPLIVKKGEGPSLLGRNWLSVLKLDWQHIFKVEVNHNLQGVLNQFSEVFKKELGTVLGVKAKMHVEPGTSPIFHKSRPVPFSLRAKVEAELDRLLREGIIEPVRYSDWAAPIVPVPKGDDTVRICGDYKVTINRAAKIDRYPLPRIEDLFATLAGGKLFTKLDLSHAYQQVELEEESRELVCINTHKGLFRYKRLPFGVASAPSIFQRVMDTLLQGIPGVCVYIDDILITGKNNEEHLANLAGVLNRLSESGVRLKREKCSFLLPSVEYLGHVISAEGLKTSESKVKAVTNAPTPTSVSELRSFLGLVNYYSKFLPDLASILAPLYSLLQKKKKWVWKKPQENAFHRVKELLRSSRVLVHFNEKLPLILACDASPYGLGAVLSHRMPDGSDRPIGFVSRTLSVTEKRYSQLDKEALAIIFGVRRYHQYLYGREFELKTDHKPLIYIFSEKKGIPTLASGRIQRWALILGAYRYTIQHQLGKDNIVADAMSRLPIGSTPPEARIPSEVIHLMEHLDASPTTSAQIRRWTNHDPVLSKVREWILTDWPAQESSQERF